MAVGADLHVERSRRSRVEASPDQFAKAFNRFASFLCSFVRALGVAKRSAGDSKDTARCIPKASGNKVCR